MPGEIPARWDRVHQPAPPGSRQPTGLDVYRVRMDAGGETYGSIWGVRSKGAREPDRTATRLLAAAADQLGQALRQDRLAAEAQAADVARQADALKSALLQSVSHDLRTPLATIRAAAGTLRPGSRLSEADQAESADAIDREVEYLNRLVTNLLDLSRIEAGALRAERDVFELDDLVGRTLERLGPRLAGRTLDVEPRRAAGPRRPRVHRRGGDERRRERDQVHAARHDDPRRGRAGRRRVRPPDDRGRRPGRPRRGAAAAVRQVLPGAERTRRIPIRDGDRARRRPRAHRGHRRPSRRPTERSRRARDRPGPARRRPSDEAETA